jgi:CheY-like chemotaxis protein
MGRVPVFTMRKPSLLIVDDEPNVLLTLKLVLEEDGYQISTAASFAEAVTCSPLLAQS